MAERDEGIWQVDTDRHVRGSAARAILRYVERALGKDAADAVVADAAARDGHTGHPARWITSWMSHDAICHLADAAAGACGEPDIGRRAGEEGMRILHERGLADLLRSAGTVTAAATALIDGANKSSDGRLHRVVPIDDHRLDVVATYVPPGFPSPFFCSNLTGFLVGVPALFGGEGVVAEPECMVRGDEHCRYELRWTLADGQGRSAAPSGPGTGVADAFIERFEQLHTMATELAQADDLETLLGRITDRASTSVRARRHALA
ncbi:MAG: hypothetical protein KY461_15445, partial [Actinobacteria bacterium]|nr:hypothetical protein [Actinomycetota bacterium]